MKTFAAIATLLAFAAPRPASAEEKAQTTVTWWGHAAFIVTTPGGATLAIDPFFSNPKAPKDAKLPASFDAVLVTHGHGDHVGAAADLCKAGAMLIGSFELTTLVGCEKASGGNIGGTIVVKDAKIHLVPAVHSSGFGQEPSGPKYGGPAMGYVIEIEKGPTIYHAGDTDAFGDMALIAERYHPTVALLPIGGHFTMDPAGAALAAKLLKVKTVIPMHYQTFPLIPGSPADLKKGLEAQKSSAKMVELEPGKPMKL